MTQYTDLEIPPPPATASAPASPSKKKSGWLKWITLGCGGLILLAVLFVGAILASVFGMMRSSEPYQEAVRRAKADTRVVVKLGAPIETGWFSSGNINVTGSSGNADLTVPLKGAKSQGSVHVVAKKENGKWRYLLLRVATADGTQIDLQKAEAVEQDY